MDKLKNIDVAGVALGLSMLLGEFSTWLINNSSALAMIPTWAYVAAFVVAAAWRYRLEQSKDPMKFPELTIMERAAKDEFIRLVAQGVPVGEALSRAKQAAIDRGR
ncbi:MAG: hypothetical protein M0R28_17745 [Pigmentiphaga sp.]|nr:hypothetical protein [Pigmentiphaga sp.]